MSGQQDTMLRWSQGAPLPAGSVRFIVDSVAPYLEARAAAERPHGSICPAALHIDPAGRVSLGGASGTPDADAHAAPEVLAGESPTARSDVFSLASTAYTLLTGQPPNPYGFATVRRARPDLDPTVDGVLAQATARGPEFRFASATAFGAALATALGVPAVPFEPVAAPASPTGSTASAASAPVRRGRFELSETGLSLVFIAVVVVLVAGCTALFVIA